MDNTHAKPLMLSGQEYTALSRSKVKETDRQEIVESKLEVPPSLYQDINGKSLLANEMKMKKDDDRSFKINDFILEKLKIENYKDNLTSYRGIFKELTKDVDVGKFYDSEYVLDKIYNYLFGSNLSEKDFIVLSILAQKYARKRR